MSYQGTDLQRLLGLLQSGQTPAAGQNLPTQADGAQSATTPPPPPPPSPAPASAADQFATDTLSSLLGAQGSSTSSAANSLASMMMGALDGNGDGSLSLDEVNQALTGSGSSSSSSDIASAFSALDTNKDGVVSAQELAAALQSSGLAGGSQADPTQQAAAQGAGGHYHHHHHHGGGGAESASSASASGMASQIVGSLDANDDGTVSLDEITQALSASGTGSTASTTTSGLASAFSALDTNGDGKLSADELTTAIQAYQAQMEPAWMQAQASSGSTVSAAA